jgi:hypothetical protein
MKKLLLLSVMALASLAASAQFGSKSSSIPQSPTKMVNVPQSQHTYQAVAPRQDRLVRSFVPCNQLTLDPAKVKPLTRAQRAFLAMQSAMQDQTKVLGKGKAQNRMNNLRPLLILNPQLTKQAKAVRKAPAFAESYLGRGGDYGLKETVEWTMIPTTATKIDPETSEESEVDVMVDVIPTPDFLSEFYPNGFPIEYTIDDDGVITIMPQAIAAYDNEELDAKVYITLFSANSDAEDGTITMQLDESGKLEITDGNLICLGEFAGVEFDEEMGDGEAYLGWDELITNVNYYLNIETVIDNEYLGHGVDYFEQVGADWTMQRGKTIMDDDEFPFFVDMIPTPETFSALYPNGIDVEYEKKGDTYIVKPQVIASAVYEDGEEEYVILCSYTTDDGCIVLTEDENGSLKTIDEESICIGSWSTSQFDETWESYQGAYLLIKNVKYRLPDEPAEAPEDVFCEPDELVLFASLGLSGYTYNDNLAVMGAYAPTTFRNGTFDIATGFEWSVTEYDDEETNIISTDRNFTLTTKGGASYENFSLIAYNQDKVSEPYTWGTGHCPNNDENGPRYETLYAYAGHGQSSFQFSDGTYATMTRQNPDGDLTFYTNWGTPDKYERTEISKIYSYQGKPSTPLYFTGVTLPLVGSSFNDDFNLHIKICKCNRSVSGRLEIGDIIAEGDATTENINADYDIGLTSVDFDELYVEDEFGMSETIDYLFVEDEFVIIIEDWNNGTFSGILGSQDIDVSHSKSTWFEKADEPGSLYSYNTWFPQLLVGLIDATYGYLYTEDDTNLIFDKDGGSSSIHVDPMYYTTDDETGEPSYLLNIESVTEDGEEVDVIPEWISVDVANEDYTTATETDEDGEEYTYFVHGIDYDLVFNLDPLSESIESRTAQFVFYQIGAKLTVTVTQDIDPDGIHTVVEKTPIKNGRAFNLAGQPVGKNYKGIVVKDGKCILVK